MFRICSVLYFRFLLRILIGMAANTNRSSSPLQTTSSSSSSSSRDATNSATDDGSRGLDVVEPYLLATHQQRTFKDRKYRLHGNVWLVVSIYRNVVCIHLRELTDGWKFEGGVTMNTSEYEWFSSESIRSSGTFGRIDVAKTMHGSLVKRVDARLAGTTGRSRQIFVNHQGFTTLLRHKPSIAQDIEEASAFAEMRDLVQALPQNHQQTIQDILTYLAVKAYEERRRDACDACTGRCDPSNLLSHACLQVERKEMEKWAEEALDSVPNGVLWSVLACNNLPHPRVDVSAIANTTERADIIRKIMTYDITTDAQTCFDTYYNMNTRFITTDNSHSNTSKAW